MLRAVSCCASAVMLPQFVASLTHSSADLSGKLINVNDAQSVRKIRTRANVAFSCTPQLIFKLLLGPLCLPFAACSAYLSSVISAQLWFYCCDTLSSTLTVPFALPRAYSVAYAVS